MRRREAGRGGQGRCRKERGLREAACWGAVERGAELGRPRQGGAGMRCGEGRSGTWRGGQRRGAAARGRARWGAKKRGAAERGVCGLGEVGFGGTR